MGYNAGGWIMSSLTSELPRRRATTPGLYERDGYGWALQQAEALRRRDLAAIDWDNVIEEIESVGRAERGRWVSHCARAIEHMLAIEHWKGATAGDLKHWQDEIEAFRRGMADALDENPGLQGAYGELLALAWRIGRRAAVKRLAGYAAEEAGADDERPHTRVVRAQLPGDCPYLVEHVSAYDPKLDEDPRPDVWPPAVAVRLNTALGRDYEILPGPERSSGWSR